MLKVCVIIVIIKMEGIKNHGNACIKNYTPMDYVKIAISINIIKWKEKNVLKINILKMKIIRILSNMMNQIKKKKKIC